MVIMTLRVCLLLMLHISLIRPNEDVVYLKREKRKSWDEINHVGAGIRSFSKDSEEDDGKVNPFYASGEGSAEGSADGSGSPNESELRWGSADVEEQMSTTEYKEMETESGEDPSGEGPSGDGPSGDIDASLAELLQNIEKRSTFEGDSPNEDAERNQNERRAWKAEDHDSKLIHLTEESKSHESNKVEMKRRDVESKSRILLLEKFFKLMGSDELKVTKRDLNGVEGDFENDGEKFKDEKHMNTEAHNGPMKARGMQKNVNDDLKRSGVAIKEKELKIRKREVEDIGDETVPNLSYIHKEEDDKMMNLRSEDTGLDVERRNVIDGDNAVRFLEEVNMEHLFTKQENEMLDKITRGRRNDNLESAFENSQGNSKRLVGRKQEIPLIKMTTSARPKRESGEGVALRKWQPTETASDGGNVNIRNTRQSEDSPLVTKRGLMHSTMNTINKIRREFNNQKENIQSVFQRINKEKTEKRNVIYDDEIDADNFMANYGRSVVPVKEKRNLQRDDFAADYGTKMLNNDDMMDDIDGLPPLRNEYFDNLIRKRETEENKIEFDTPSNAMITRGDLGTSSKLTVKMKMAEDGLQMDAEKSGINRRMDQAENAKRKLTKQKTGQYTGLSEDLPIGTYAKPTKVSGYWSGLGSQPIFVHKNFAGRSEDVSSGSGSSESLDNRAPVYDSRQRKTTHRNSEHMKPEEVGKIMNSNDKKKLKSKEYKNNGRKLEEKRGRKRTGREEEIDERINKNITKDSTRAIVAFDELHEVVSRKPIKDKHKKAKKVRNETQDERISKEKKFDNDDEESGEEDEGESGEEEGTKKQIRSYEDDDSVEQTLSAKYQGNDVIEKKSKIIVKRTPFESGYIGCYIDVFHPMRDLAVRAGIPFVTVNNCRSACKRTGYYYAGLQFGYLCFCGNSYGKYDMAPDSECNYACSGDTNQTCGGLWRNSIYYTAGAPLNSNEGPVPFYLPPQQQQGIEINVKRSEIPLPPTNSNSTQFGYNSTQNSSSIRSNASQTVQQQQQPVIVATQGIQGNASLATNATIIKDGSQNASRSKNMAAKTTEDGKRKVLMHFAYQHSQQRHQIAPTKSPAPTPPLRIEPQTRVFKGEIKLKQKWFDDYKDKMSIKSLILAGNVEQALKNIYANSKDQNDFLKAEVLSFRESEIKSTINSITRVVAEFALTFDQNVISPDARLFSSVHAAKKLDEMPVYPKSLKVSEYRFDPNTPGQPFKVPIKEPANYSMSENDDNEERRKSTIALPTVSLPNEERRKSNIALPIVSLPMAKNSPDANSVDSGSMQELQDYLKSENSLPPFENQKTGMLGIEQESAANNVQGGSFESETNRNTKEELSKRSEIPLEKTNQRKLPYILRLFFWKDMLARRKRQSGIIEKDNKGLLRGRRGDVETYRKSKNQINIKHEKIRKRFDKRQVPLTEEGSFERLFMGKVKRKTKDLAAEKELKRSKRLDAFDDFE